MGKLTPSKELRTVYKVLKRIHAAEQLEETDPGMGSSPRMRGARADRPCGGIETGIIPAYAGSTKSATRFLSIIENVGRIVCDLQVHVIGHCSFS